ncbi:MAG: lipid-A-disaccharide synthase [Pseudomonadota bacterium]
MRVFLIAGEPSGDRLGGQLMHWLQRIAPEVSFMGIGGPAMSAQGLQSRFAMEELSVMGIAEVLPKYRHLMRRINETADAVVSAQPDVLLTIDSPDFSLRVAKRVKARTTIRTVHYVAPTVWAWRPGRAEKMARMIDEVLCLFPFEPPYMEAAGMRAHFVGHPVVTEPQADAAQAAAFRAEMDLSENTPLVLALPGSRKGEISRLAPIFGKSLSRISDVHPSLRVVVPTVRHTEALVRELVGSWPGEPLVLTSTAAEAKRAAFRAADVALAASGTVSLELAAAGTPMVIAYDMNVLSRWLIGAMLKVDTVTLVNLVSETRVVPEFLGGQCDPVQIAPAVLDALSKQTARDAQSAAMHETMKRLGQGGDPPGLRAARAVLGE